MTDESDIIYTYSRQDAVTDGVRVDVANQARAAGIGYPVAVTEAVWRIVSGRTAAGQSVEGRLWDTLWMFRLAARGQTGSEVHFSVLYATERGTEEVKLCATCGPGDDGEPVSQSCWKGTTEHHCGRGLRLGLMKSVLQSV